MLAPVSFTRSCRAPRPAGLGSSTSSTAERADLRARPPASTSSPVVSLALRLGADMAGSFPRHLRVGEGRGERGAPRPPTRGPGPSSHPPEHGHLIKCNNNPARARRACRRSRYARRRSRIGSIGARMTPRASRARSPSPSDRRRQFACFGGHTLLEATGLRRQWAIPQRGM